jgi:glutaredoxin 3
MAAVPRIVIYLKSWCPYCVRARALLQSKRVEVQEIDIESQPDRREEMIRRSGQRTVPQIFIGDRHVGGCDDLHALDAAGGLDPLLVPHTP